jgi:RNA polymerase sigma-70 factor (ECF subfamily)
VSLRSAAPRAAAPASPEAGVGAFTGDEPFQALFQAQVGHVWRSLRALGVQGADVADASQQVFIVLHANLARWDRACTLRAYMYGICLRVASDHRRKAHRRRERLFASPPETVSGATSPEDDVVHRQELRFLDDALGELPAAQREVFVLFEIEELDMTEVAQAVGCPLFTAYSRLRGARKAIGARMARSLEERTQR